MVFSDQLTGLLADRDEWMVKETQAGFDTTKRNNDFTSHIMTLNSLRISQSSVRYEECVRMGWDRTESNGAQEFGSFSWDPRGQGEAQRGGSAVKLPWDQWRHCQLGLVEPVRGYLRWGTCHLLLLPNCSAVTNSPRGA